MRVHLEAVKGIHIARRRKIVKQRVRNLLQLAEGPFVPFWQRPYLQEL